MTTYEEITKVQITRGRKYTAPEPWKFDIEMEIGPERLPYQVVKTIKEDCPVNKDRKVLERWDIILGVEQDITIGWRAKNVKRLIRATGLKCDLILLRPNLYTMGEKAPFKFRSFVRGSMLVGMSTLTECRSYHGALGLAINMHTAWPSFACRSLCLETLRRSAPIVLVVEMTKRHNCEWPSYGFETFKVCEHEGPKRFFRADIVRHVFNVNIVGRMDKAEQIELIRKDLWDIFTKQDLPVTQSAHTPSGARPSEGHPHHLLKSISALREIRLRRCIGVIGKWITALRIHVGTAKGDLLPPETVEKGKQRLWNQIYMGDVLLKLNDFLLFDNEDFVNLRIEIKEKVALTILPLSPMRSFLRTEEPDVNPGAPTLG
ncbi:hypothetical protein BIW11_08311 [Tropilaelaps mercedesae]|uniref:Uncharacterized protein n=1 Tax=Tropilaelaps mercedesae TaxID=418985 RepID=A0A1V9XQ61_9ACAR|nr:hypothetical protein BIW11_08311 [Tropilaelaps mercedesae]